jgi:hypothetical protein
MSLNPDGAPAGYYYEAGAMAYLIDPAGTYSLAGASAPTADPAGTYSGEGANAPALAAAGTYIPVTRATSAAAEIVSPPGTYCPAGASGPIADPGGTYSAAGASAPTTDPAGKYSSPYALDRLFMEINSIMPVIVRQRDGRSELLRRIELGSVVGDRILPGLRRRSGADAVHESLYRGAVAIVGRRREQFDLEPVAKHQRLAVAHQRNGLLGQRQPFRRSEFLSRGGRDSECVQYELANPDQYSGRLDHARLGFVHGNDQRLISGSHIRLGRQHRARRDASTLEFDSTVSSSTTVGSQNIGLTGGGTLDLTDPTSFYSQISDFAAGDTVELLGSWAFSGISDVAGVTTLTLASGGTTHAFEFVGNFTQSNFSITPGATTVIGHM